MKNLNLLIPYYASMTSILKIFILYILSKWYGVSFAFPFVFLFFKVYQITINKRYNFLPLTLFDYFHILKSIFQKNYIKEINLKINIQKEEIIKLLKQLINNSNDLKKVIVYKNCNYYWKILPYEALENKIIIDKDINNLNLKLNKKFELLKEPSYKLIFVEKGNKLIIKYNSITFKYINFFCKYLEENCDNANFKEKKINKFIKLILELVTFPLYLSLEIIIIFLLSINYSY